MKSFGKNYVAAFLTAIAGASLLSACSGDDTHASSALTVGTTDKVTSLDPAGSYDNGSFAVQNQVYAFLFNTRYGSPDAVPDLAESGEFASPTQFTVTLKPGLTFANGDALTSSDVKFSFDRIIRIADDNGPSALLYNLASVETPNELTAVFNLKTPNDQVFRQILTSPAGPIVDEEVFPVDRLATDQQIVDANAFTGQYTIASYDFNNLISYKVNPDYAGVLGPAKTELVNAKYYTSQNNLKLDIQQGAIDVALRSLSPTDVSDLENDPSVSVHHGPGGEIRFFAFNFQTQPFGSTTPDSDPSKALAVRQAVADLVDRTAIAKDVYKGTYSPLYSFVADGLTGSVPVFKSLYGNGNGGPNKAKAQQTLETAGIRTPITINIQYNTDHYGASSGDEYTAVKSQLESSGLFEVNLQSTEWVQYLKDRRAGIYSSFQLGWFPDYSDADNYLTPMFYNPTDTESVALNHYQDPAVDQLILQQGATADRGERTAILEKIQNDVALSVPTLPLLQGDQLAVAGKDITGVDDTLDPSFKFRYAALGRG